jgi:hypothetical protein
MEAKSSSLEENCPSKKENSSPQARNFLPPLKHFVGYTF